MEVGQFSIFCHLRNYEDGFVWAFTGVYGPISKRYRESFWEELGLSIDRGMSPSALEGILMCQGSLASAANEGSWQLQ